ncbi:OLC1v1019835C1 [Oldenlandia corymbosa var. corymbosa]|uniref:OLC1v1019835C1 n=1 Tax=Oldenlandia corymbosa var. corymbosa TaxID=529605 RepID=A0AAV1EF22_OLDCO|nr:OLC1v1019835C1 [Oldenlandia corymbosa var. corymbosa]
MARPARTAAAGKPAKSPVTKTKAAAEKVKKAPVSAASKKVRSHPPYYEMIKEAIATLKERTGSSVPAIAKFVEDKEGKNLPPNFKKLLFIQLKKFVASGKLTKVKNSYKLAAPVKPEKKPVAEKKPAAAVPKKEAPKRKRAAGADDKEKKPKKTAAAKKTAVKKTPVKKAPTKKVVKPKSLKSPAKKMKK